MTLPYIVHCTTNESPAKLLLGRELKSRFNLLKPPITKAIIEAKQYSMIENFKGRRNIKLLEGQKVYVRTYKNPNKAGWSPAVVKKCFGPRNYSCLLTHENREIKRHIDQIKPRDEQQLNKILKNEPIEPGSQSQAVASTSTMDVAHQLVNNSVGDGEDQAESVYRYLVLQNALNLVQRPQELKN